MRKTYHYHIHHDPILDPFTRLHCLHIWLPLDVPAMRSAARLLEGTHDFSAFANKTRLAYAVRVAPLGCGTKLRIVFGGDAGGADIHHVQWGGAASPERVCGHGSASRCARWSAWRWWRRSVA